MENIRTKVCRKANELIKKGYTKSKAFKTAWAMVKEQPRKKIEIRKIEKPTLNIESKEIETVVKTESTKGSRFTVHRIRYPTMEYI